MALIALPFPLFVNGSASDGGQVTSNFSTIVNAINGNLDNTNVGAAGIFASQIKAGNSLQATFTASTIGFTFLAGATSVSPLTATSIASATAPTGIFNMGTTQSVAGLQVNGAASISGNLAEFVLATAVKPFLIASSGAAAFLAGTSGVVPLTVSGVTSQSVDIFDVTLTSGGTKALSVLAAGALQLGNIGGSTLPNAASLVGGSSGALLLNATGGQNITLSTGATASTTLAQFVAGTGIINGYIVASSLGTSYSNPGAASGDGVFQRTSSTGAVFIGGLSSAVEIDYNVANSGAVSFRNLSAAYIALNASAFTISSDAALKKNVQKLHYGLDAVMALKPSSFVLKSDGEATVGFIAQDVMAVIPEAVRTDSDGLLGFSIVPLLAANTSAIQDMVAKLKAAGVAGF